MKITKIIKSEKQDIPFSDIQPGQVYKTYDEVTCLKLNNNKAVLLLYSDGFDWLAIAEGYKGEPAMEILGTIKEIIVE